ncbi:MAG TPA: RNA polymerase sigma factor [Thermoanaerobaculia bacterium]|nr:RNA polymerase sigma factor [Thermoanaerobaculia bacterium]
MKTDLDLLNLVRRGDPAGATGLFEKYADALLRFADRMISNRAEAEEITQEVFLKMITRVEQYDGRAAVSSWLFAIAANACRDRLRRSRRAVVVPLDAVAEAPARGEPIENRLHERARRQAVRQALSKLSDEQREALVLARYHGMPYAEIARTLQITEGAVKTRIFRAMETLKGIFSEGGTTWNAMTS